MSRPGYVNYYVQEGEPRQVMLDELCKRLGLGTEHRDRVAALDAAVGIALMRGKGKKMKITVEFSEDSLFGNLDPEAEGYDVPTSVQQFAESLVNHIYHDYPDAEIEVNASINDRVVVDGPDWPYPDTVVEDIENLVEIVFNGDSWLAYVEQD